MAILALANQDRCSAQSSEVCFWASPPWRDLVCFQSWSKRSRDHSILLIKKILWTSRQRDSNLLAGYDVLHGQTVGVKPGGDHNVITIDPPDDLGVVGVGYRLHHTAGAEEVGGNVRVPIDKVRRTCDHRPPGRQHAWAGVARSEGCDCP